MLSFSDNIQPKDWSCDECALATQVHTATPPATEQQVITGSAVLFPLKEGDYRRIFSLQPYTHDELQGVQISSRSNAIRRKSRHGVYAPNLSSVGILRMAKWKVLS
jgi:hypothetical protein